jgi:hypothetical protein
MEGIIMKVINDKSGSQVESIQEFEIATGTVVAEGMVVKLTDAKVVPVVAGETAAILGVAKEAHSGSADGFNPRSNGLKILVSDSPTAIYECSAPKVTATGGSTTTFVSTAIVGTYGTDAFKGGKLKVISKVAGSTNTDAIGTLYDITASHTSNGTITFATIAGAVTAGDICQVFPPIGFALGNFDAAFYKLVLTGSSSMPIKVVGYNTDLGTIRFEAALHEFGNKKA